MDFFKRSLFVITISCVLFNIQNNAMNYSTDLERNEGLVKQIDKLTKDLQEIENAAKRLGIDKRPDRLIGGKDLNQAINYYKTELSQFKEYSDTGKIVSNEINKSKLEKLAVYIEFFLKGKIRSKFVPEFLMSEQEKINISLSKAVRDRNLELIQQLVKSGADLNALTMVVVLGSAVDDTVINLPLEIAMKAGYFDVIELLLKLGADPSEKGYQGISILEEAINTEKFMEDLVSNNESFAIDPEGQMIRLQNAKKIVEILNDYAKKRKDTINEALKGNLIPDLVNIVHGY